MRTLRLHQTFKGLGLYAEFGRRVDPIDAASIRGIHNPERSHTPFFQTTLLGFLLGSFILFYSLGWAIPVWIITMVVGSISIISFDQYFSRNYRIILIFENGAIEVFKIKPSESNKIISFISSHEDTPTYI